MGADGLRSAVRRLAVDPRPPVPVGQHSWRFLAAAPPEVTSWTVMLGRGASFLSVPVGGGRAYCYADVSADPAAGRPPATPWPTCAAGSPGFAAPVPELLAQLEGPAQVHMAPIEQVAEQRWGQGAVVLVGDAAHGMSPSMAQGAALAFEDALVLADCLRDAAGVEALASFVERRQARAGWVRAQTEAPRPHPQPAAAPAGPAPADLRPPHLPLELPAAGGQPLEAAQAADRLGQGPDRLGEATLEQRAKPSTRAGRPACSTRRGRPPRRPGHARRRP